MSFPSSITSAARRPRYGSVTVQTDPAILAAFDLIPAPAAAPALPDSRAGIVARLMRADYLLAEGKAEVAHARVMRALAEVPAKGWDAYRKADRAWDRARARAKRAHEEWLATPGWQATLSAAERRAIGIE